MFFLKNAKQISDLRISMCDTCQNMSCGDTQQNANKFYDKRITHITWYKHHISVHLYLVHALLRPTYLARPPCTCI